MSYQIHEFIPFEGYDIKEHDTLQELKRDLEGRKRCWGFEAGRVSVYEIVREISIEEILGG